MKLFKNISAEKRTFIFLMVMIVAVFATVFFQRLSDYFFWMENPQTYVVEDTIAMSTTDAYYWLKMAKELDAGTLGKGQVEPTKGYPDQALLAIKDTPSLLAEMISFGKIFTGGNYYRSGLFLIPILAGLFVFPLFFYFNQLGFGASAIFGGLFGAFSHSYYDRTMMGRLDTDLLNTFFPLATACFILPIRKENSFRINALLVFTAGLCLNLFVRWYQQPSFILLFLLVLPAYLLITGIPWKHIVVLAVIFLAVIGPEYLSQVADSVRTFVNAYISPPPTGSIAWPDILNTIDEAKRGDIWHKVELLHGLPLIVLVGFSGLIYLCVRHYKKMIPISPMLVLGIWAFVGPDRFLMYLAPMIGIGVGVVIELLVRRLGQKMGRNYFFMPIASVALMLILFFSTAAYTGFPENTGPSFKAGTIKAFLDIKKLVPHHSAMFTPFWEYGYALMEIGDFATYHDGGLQGGIRGTLTAKAMISSRQEDMLSLLSYLEDNGFNTLAAKIRKEKMTAEQMKKLVFSYSEPFRGENVYVLYLDEMIPKFAALSYLGNWDFAKGASQVDGYHQLNCSSLTDKVMTCGGVTVDLAKGIINDGRATIPMKAALFINDGYVASRKDYGNDKGYYLQVVMKNNVTYKFYLLDENVYRSNFNQQFLLGNFDHQHFEEVYNKFPDARLLKVK